MNNQEKLAT